MNANISFCGCKMFRESVFIFIYLMSGISNIFKESFINCFFVYFMFKQLLFV